MLKSLIIQASLFLYLLSNISCTKTGKKVINAIDNDEVLNSAYVIANKQRFNNEFKYQCASANKRWNLNLDTLEFGFNTLQIRIWLGNTKARVNHLIVIKRKNKQWFGLLYKLKRDETGYSSTVENVKPKSGWNNLIDNLNKLKIFSIDNSSGYDGNGGGDIPFHIVEISTPTKYHSYEYDILEGYTDKFWQAKNVQLISELFEHEFDFNYTR
jgi:hypothetical protein